MAAVRKTVEQCCCHLCITEDLCPFTEAEVGRDDDAGALIIELAQKVEQQCTARRAKGQIGGARRTLTLLGRLDLRHPPP